MTRDALVAGAFAAIQHGSKSFRAASRLFDRETRERAWLLYCWCRHCDDVCDGQTLGFGSGPRGPVSMLREKTHRAASRQIVGELPFDALGQLLKERPIPLQFLDDHLEGFTLDELGWRPQTEEDLIRYCYHVAGTVGCMMAIVMGVAPDDTETLERAADLGIAFQLSNIARDVREDLDNGRCYLPAEWMQAHGVTPQTVFDPTNRMALLAIVDRLVDSVIVYESSARKGVQRLPFRSRLAVLTALRIYGAIGRRVGRLGVSAWDRRVTVGKTRKLAMLVPSFAEAVSLRRRA
ncbi:phytoene/squalene synthase family protein [Sphingomonas sinipercae]|uniref:Phytoene/squalene synthase family protein n=1 Tax=Sphingomonas sinipercae TaxID=2714944 RepID=A0A6G7ZMF0_9SPHN|nr:phytoene/squalene synthase family protein [Sphingomonas sinipercae]QIL02105.1 phytoene/squalene synthase family protein [Sphingomonas sinipercae]